MINKLIEEQLNKVLDADLSHFDEASNTFFIPKKNEIKLEVDSFYLIKLKPQIFINEVLKNNWNKGSTPPGEYLKVDVCNKLGNMFKVNCIVYDNNTKQDLTVSWSGWLPADEIEVLQKL